MSTVFSQVYPKMSSLLICVMKSKSLCGLILVFIVLGYVLLAVGIHTKPTTTTFNEEPGVELPKRNQFGKRKSWPYSGHVRYADIENVNESQSSLVKGTLSHKRCPM